MAVRCYLRYGLSYRDVEELLAERGVEVDHVTVYRWVQRFTPLFADAARPCRQRTRDQREGHAMTGHNPSGRPANHEPPPTETTATSLGATGSPPADPNVELDRELAASAQRLLEALQSTLDIDAGLAVIRATHRTATGHPASSRHDGDRQAGDHEEPATSSAVGAVCLVLAGYLADLAPASDDRTDTPPGLGGSVLALSAAHRLLRELRTGLLHRTLNRDAADRLLRLIDHNTAEAGQLLREERRRTSRRTRPQADVWAQTATEVRDGTGALRPWILRLFDDADQATTTQPAPRLPV